MGENGPPYFAEYSLWNDSAYCMIPLTNRIEFMRPVGGSIFLTPDDLQGKEKDDNVEAEQSMPQESCVRNSPGFQRYIRRAFKVVTREDLHRDPALFRKDPESDESDTSLDRSVYQEMYLRPPRPRWRTPQQVNGRGRKMNLMQRRLEQALAQPANIERGANMMHRMGWEGGALGRDGVGIVEPIAPNPYLVRMLNAAYAHTTAGLGMPQQYSDDDSSDSDTTRVFRQIQKSKKIKKQEFIMNVLLYIREFIKNDLQVEMFFEPKLTSGERRTVHQIVGNIMREESDVVFETIEMIHLIEDIERRNNYLLGTVSKGEAPQRQICIYKEALDSTYLVTPSDIRHEQEEESNPFLLSIAKHHHNTPQDTLRDRMIDFFIEFAEENDYTEFRFLGAFNMTEIEAISSFLGMITGVIDNKPGPNYPERLINSFHKEVTYTAEEDANGYISIKKWFKEKTEEDEKKEDKIEEPAKE